MPEAISRAANARNNGMHQHLRFGRWAGVRDSAWRMLRHHLNPGASVAIVGGGSCDDMPLRRMLEHGVHVTLIDFDADATARACERVSEHGYELATCHVDVTDGGADTVLLALREGTPAPELLDLPHGALPGAPYDIVVGDMLYTQLLHAGLLSLGITGARQHELMQRYDPPLARALVERLHASARTGGHVLHVHDVACWTREHPQPISLRRALRRADTAWRSLRRHDACDPHLIVEQMGVTVCQVAWWAWPFEPNKQFLVRATLVQIST